MKKLLLIVGIIIVLVAAIVLGLFSYGSGLGFGSNVSSGMSTSQKSQSKENSDVSSIRPNDSVSTESSSSDAKLGITDSLSLSPSRVIILISEDSVTIEGVSIQDPDELKQVIERLYSDGVSFELEEKNSILATREWVVEVFDDLKIPLKGLVE